MPSSRKSVVTIALILLFGAMAARAEEETPLVCEFRQSVGIAIVGPISPKEEARRYSFPIPTSWHSASAPHYQTVVLRWTNLTYGWDGNATAILQARMVTIVEQATSSDNLFVVNVWLDKASSSGALEAVYIMAGHSALPKEYEASTLSIGQCSLGSNPR